MSVLNCASCFDGATVVISVKRGQSEAGLPINSDRAGRGGQCGFFDVPVTFLMARHAEKA
jgi:hypothetical protein